ncbi:hypothetical protein Aperf_G00000062774 [Anoplocephala perfoliata]
MPTKPTQKGHHVVKSPQFDSEDEDEGWTCALSKGMRRRIKAKGCIGPFSITLPPSQTNQIRRKVISLPDDSPSALRAKFGTALNCFLRPAISPNTTSLVKTVLGHLRNHSRIQNSAAILLCLGLGNPAVNTSSLRQLAFLAALVQLSEGAFVPTKTYVYDPVLKNVAREFIRGLGFCILSSNLEGQYCLPRDQPTLVFLPHCPIALAESLIACNWHQERLNRLTFLTCPLEPRQGLPEVPCLSHLQHYRHHESLNTNERDFEGLRIEWFDLPPGLELGPVKTASKNPTVTGDLLTFENISSFIDGGDAKTTDAVS